MRWRHKKTGGTYKEIGRGNLQITGSSWDMEPMVMYQSEQDSMFWARPTKEFEDGRFEEIEIVPGPILEDMDHEAKHLQQAQPMSGCPHCGFYHPPDGMCAGPAVEVNHTEPREFDAFIKRQLAAMSTLLENSWRASLRKERDARLNEVRLKEKFKLERDRYAAEVVELNKRIEALQGAVR